MSRKPSSVSGDTRAAILKAAAEEFSALGFEKASLRSICTKANVTTGAMYGMFKDKEELFESIVSPAISQITAALAAHLENEKQDGLTSPDMGELEDMNIAEEVIKLYYENKQVCDLLLNERERPCVARFFDEIVDMMEQQMAMLLEFLPEDCAGRANFTECTMHWFAHLQVDSLLHIISHNYPKEQAAEQFRIVVKFLRSGILGLAFGN